MRIASYIQQVDERSVSPMTVFDVQVSEEYDISKELKEEIVLFEPTYEPSKGKTFYTNGFILIDQQIQSSTPLFHTFSYDSDVIVMEFFLDGSRRIWNEETSPKLISQLVKEKSHNLRYIKKGNYHSIIKPNQSNDIFMAFLSVEFYFKLINQQVDLHQEFAQSVYKKKEAQLADQYLTMNQDMRTLINNVRNCTRKGSLHRLCLEIKISELLMLQYEQHQMLKEHDLPKVVSHDTDLQRLDEAKDILEENFQNPPTIKQLALLVGINEFKLKSTFKKHYQSTIHGYVVKLRMQKAYQLIKKEGALVKETALEVGYQNPSHFSAAFREFYGYGPTEIS